MQQVLFPIYDQFVHKWNVHLQNEFHHPNLNEYQIYVPDPVLVLVDTHLHPFLRKPFQFHQIKLKFNDLRVYVDADPSIKTAMNAALEVLERAFRTRVHDRPPFSTATGLLPI